MPVAILVGIPSTYVQRAKASIQAGHAAFRAGWSILYMATGRSRPELRASEIDRTLGEAARHDAAHVVGMSTQDSAVRAEIARKIRPYFRFLWLPNRLLSHFPHQVPQFIDVLNGFLEQEEIWDEHVKPQDVASPLLLPTCAFQAHGECDHLWDAAEQFGEAGNIRAAAAVLDHFRGQHWRPTPAGPRRWIDVARRVFNHMGARHAVAPFPLDWKYSFRLPEGFHYDVTDLEGSAFRLWDALNEQHSVDRGGYLNIDPHGYVRR